MAGVRALSVSPDEVQESVPQVHLLQRQGQRYRQGKFQGQLLAVNGRFAAPPLTRERQTGAKGKKIKTQKITQSSRDGSLD